MRDQVRGAQPVADVEWQRQQNHHPTALDDAPLERIADALRRAPLAGPGRHGWAPRAADCDPRSGAVKSLPRAPSDAREGVAERAVPTRACAGTTLLPRW